MKPSNQHILETLIINKDYIEFKITPKSFYELRKIIEDRYDKLGPGTKRNPIYFNDIDVSNLDSFYSSITGIGIFEETKFKYIDISDWNVSNVTDMNHMFYGCKNLESVGDISKWDVSNVRFMPFMFSECKKFNQDLSSWNVSNVTNMAFMFIACHSLNHNLSNWDVSKVTNMASMFCSCKKFNQDISSWDVSNVNNMSFMFYNCESFNQNISKWNVLNVTDASNMFNNCPIQEKYKPKFK